jgi:hypothetical protein
MAASASDAHPFPIYNARFRLIVPGLDADGDLVTGAATPDTELSQDCGTFADATNEATEIATASGMYYIDLIATELDTKSTAVIFKSATSGFKTTPAVLYPVRLPIIRTGTAQAGGASSITLDSSASAVDDYYVGCYVNITNNSPANALGQARLITGYVGSTKVATVEGTYGTNPSSASTFEVLATELWTRRLADVREYNGLAGTFASGRPEVNTTHAAGTAWGSGAITAGAIAADAITAAKIADGAIDAGAIAADAITAAKIADGAIDAATFAAGAINAAAIAADAITAAKIADGAIDAATFATGAITADAIAADAIGSSELAASAVTEIQSGLSTLDAAGVRAAVGLASANLDTQIGDLPTNAELATSQASADDATLAAIAALNNLSAAQVNSEVDTALADIHLDHLLATDYDPASKPGVATALLNELVESDAGVSRYTANALEQAPTGGSAPTAATIADAVWDELLSGHVVSGSAGEALEAAGTAGDPWTTALPGAYGSGTAGKIIGDNINATISSRASQTSVDDLPTNAELATALAAADDAILAAIAALNNLSQANIRTALGMATANLDTQLDALPTTAELATALASADDAVLAAIAALNNLSSAQAQTAAAAALTAYDPPTKAELDTAVDALPTAVENAAAVLAAATANPIDANVQEINDVTLVGDGSTTPWGPV